MSAGTYKIKYDAAFNNREVIWRFAFALTRFNLHLRLRVARRDEMQKLRLIGAAAALLVTGAVTTAAMAQIYGPYTDTTRMAFARQGCGGSQWESKGYATYHDCYDAYYWGYPNDPNPGAD